ncbi:cation:proton antiporter [Synechococcus sp. FACHB-909]|uniref:cation:proton antiporter n=1 Tax=Synechococcus sp. FACHB-909 TaxID=2692863 RepID=UPI001682B00F|nr:cation:proton antiporter [Synechococcus sp. FACHB-909]MBD2717377.1 cation:proton antiporter [Synechococcus sp. FACHB-909]
MGQPTLLSTLLILLLGVLLARLSEGWMARLAVPAIVIELVLGFVLGNTVVPFEAMAPLSGLTELGVLTLFFQVGLEVRGDLLSSRRGAILRTVALSFCTPLLAFWPLQSGFGLSTPTTLLCLAVLSATGTGVTLRLLSQRGALQTPSGRLLVGVSVLDDLPAIGLLAIATASAGLRLGTQGIGWTGPLLGVLLAGLSWLAVTHWARRHSRRPTSALAILMLLIGSAWVGEACGLTSLLGALWGGVLMARLGPVEGEVQRVLTVLSEVFLPLYFISVGMRICAGTLLQPAAWSLAAALIVMALLSKLACGLGIDRHDRRAGVDRWLVVFGLIPRGLPGLVFATTALNQGLIDAVQFSSLVLMVTVTTVVGLVLLERRLQSSGVQGEREPDEPMPKVWATRDPPR